MKGWLITPSFYVPPLLPSVVPFPALLLFDSTPQTKALPCLDAGQRAPRSRVRWVLRGRGTQKAGIPSLSPHMVAEHISNSQPIKTHRRRRSGRGTVCASGQLLGLPQMPDLNFSVQF